MSTEAPHPSLRVEHDRAVLTVTLANPAERNAQVPSLWRALAHVGESVADDVRVVVLRGDGAAFSAGLHRSMLSGGLPGEPDLMALAAAAGDGLDDAIAGFQRGFTVWRTLPAVVVAAVQGYAIGAGFQLALAADLRLLADDAQLAMRETSLGLVPDLGGTAPLVEVVGYARALEICATGRFVGAREALDLGLANAVVPVAELGAATDDLVAALLAAPRAALRELKPLLRSAISASTEGQVGTERAAQARLLRGMARPTTT
ncbi:MAG: enoyl-CoA hydratase/isomerase family protein [Actinomycetota bacterium]|nr:enoyl-CoA hydratase/isomerase family protein [Actinomycetota bacterium]